MTGATSPISPDEFAGLMAAMEPFERQPAVAVAVSGGADSMALTLLATEWAAKRGGSVFAVTVDHRLRPGSRTEARQVSKWLAARGIPHKTLSWTGEKPATGVQAAARRKRYELLEDWCQNNDVLHLLLAHTLDDQAETFLLRLGRGSGLNGLSGMAPVEIRSGLRLLRPLLSVPHARLTATLDVRGQAWIEDPSNANEKFLRVRARTLLAGLAPEGLEAVRIADAAERLRRAREAIETDVTRLLVDVVEIQPEGYARLDRKALLAAPEEISLRALAQILMTVSGQVYPPRFDRLRHLHAELAAPSLRARTLHGCRITPATGAFRSSRFDALVTREISAIGEDVTLAPGRNAVWDGRFHVALRRGARFAGTTCVVGAIGTAGWAAVRQTVSGEKETAIPSVARAALPGFWDAKGIVAVPHLGYLRRGSGPAIEMFSALFAPRLGLTS